MQQVNPHQHQNQYSQGLIILAHGSRDAAWRQPFETLAKSLASEQAQLQVRCAYLQLCAPDLPQAAAELQAAGCRQIAIAPMFLGLGTHIRLDLPQLLQTLQDAHPDCRFTLLPVLGDSAAMQTLMAQHVLQGLQG